MMMNDAFDGIAPSQKDISVKIQTFFFVYSANRPVREKLYRAYITKASFGEHDNREVIESIRRLR